MKKYDFIAYYRVSTEKQGRSGLGLNAQQSAVRKYALEHGNLRDEFQDIESGAKDDRDGLKQAIQACRFHGATLLVKDVSRISRSGLKFLAMLDEYRVNYIETDTPNDNQFIKDIRASMAREERESISKRTRAALEEIKKDIEMNGKHITKEGKVITSLGKRENFTSEGRKKGTAVRMQMARVNPTNTMAYAFAQEMYKNGQTFSNIMRALNRAGFKTVQGKDWKYQSVKRLFNLYNDSKV